MLPFLISFYYLLTEIFIFFKHASFCLFFLTYFPCNKFSIKSGQCGIKLIFNSFFMNVLSRSVVKGLLCVCNILFYSLSAKFLYHFIFVIVRIHFFISYFVFVFVTVWLFYFQDLLENVTVNGLEWHPCCIHFLKTDKQTNNQQ